MSGVWYSIGLLLSAYLGWVGSFASRLSALACTLIIQASLQACGNNWSTWLVLSFTHDIMHRRACETHAPTHPGSALPSQRGRGCVKCGYTSFIRGFPFNIRVPSSSPLCIFKKFMFIIKLFDILICFEFLNSFFPKWSNFK